MVVVLLVNNGYNRVVYSVYPYSVILSFKVFALNRVHKLGDEEKKE